APPQRRLARDLPRRAARPRAGPRVCARRARGACAHPRERGGAAGLRPPARRGHGGSERLRRGSLTRARPGDNPRVKKILVATDFSAHADRALAHALELAKLFSAELELFSAAYLAPSTLAAVSLNMAPDLIGDTRRETEQQIETLAATLRARGFRATSSTSNDEPSAAIAARAAAIGAGVVAGG